MCLTGAPTTSLTTAEAAETTTNLISCAESVLSPVRRGHIMLYMSFPLLVKLVTNTEIGTVGTFEGWHCLHFSNQILISDYFYESGESSKFVVGREILNLCSKSNHSQLNRF